MSFLNALRVESSRKATRTENGMPANTSSANYCVDMFGTIGSARGWSEEDIIKVFSRALGEDPLIALKILFWARDIRNGAGERRVFRICLNYLNNNYREYLDKNMHLVPVYGRWDDLFELDNSLVFQTIIDGLKNKDGLLGKWLPRKGKIKGDRISTFINKLRKSLDLSPKDYRKLIVGLSNTVEQDMCANKWEKIEYSHVPSQAMLKYRKAFFKHDDERFQEYLDSVKSGSVKINAGAMFPYQLYDAVKNATGAKDIRAVEAQWSALPNFMEGSTEKILPVCDVSGSMCSSYFGNVTPMSVCVSLGLYISERNDGPFKDAFITFSNTPSIQYLKGSLVTRCRQLLKAHWAMNTDLEATFKMLLDTAIKNNVQPKDMPTMLLIISDMQFDRCVHKPKAPASKMIRTMYKKAGYSMPKLVFWNVNARVDQVPVMSTENNTALVSGCSPSIMKSVLVGNIFNPVQTMLNTVNTERYAAITI